MQVNIILIVINICSTAEIIKSASRDVSYHRNTPFFMLFIHVSPSHSQWFNYPVYNIMFACYIIFIILQPVDIKEVQIVISSWLY
jgi:hypothetical protein